MFTIGRMPKRNRDMGKHSDEDRRRKPRLKIMEAPPINSIADLIELGQSIKLYKNLDNVMLWRIRRAFQNST
jgi:hypothetical protein